MTEIEKYETMNTRKYVAAIAVLTLAATACGSDEDSSGGDEAGADLALISGGTLTICSDVPFPPMEFEDPDGPGGFNGFDIQLASTIAADLGLEFAVVTPGFDAITSGLAMEAGDCDISVASITITEEREESIDFTDSYFSAEQSLLVADDSDATSTDDLGKIAVQSGTTGEIYARDNVTNELVSFEDAGSLYVALEAGEVEGVLTDQIGNQGYADANPGVGKVIATYDTQELYGMAVKEDGSEALLEAVNGSLAKLREDGTYDEIFDTWFSA